MGLWDYYTNVSPPRDSDDGDDLKGSKRKDVEDEHGLRFLPEHKRRKMEKAVKGAAVIKPFTLDDSDEENGIDDEPEEVPAATPEPASAAPPPASRPAPQPQRDPVAEAADRRRQEVLAAALRRRQQLEEAVADPEPDEIEIEDSSREPTPFKSRADADADDSADEDDAYQPAAAPAQKLEVVLQTIVDARPRELKFSVLRDVPLVRVLTAFKDQAAREGWMRPGAPARFVFDGDPVADDDTLASLDIDEDGMRFDVLLS